MPDFTLKQSPGGPCDSIILTYDGSWEGRIIQRDFSAEFRKKGPRKFVPKFVYAYLSSPVKAISAKMSVSEFGLVSVAKALEMADETLFGEAGLLEYSSNKSHLLFYRFSAIQLAQRPISLQRLHLDYGFWPSSSYVPLSEDGEQTLDALGEFVPFE